MSRLLSGERRKRYIDLMQGSSLVLHKTSSGNFPPILGLYVMVYYMFQHYASL